MKARDGSRSRLVDRVVTRSALVRELLAEYDRDPTNEPALRDLVTAWGGGGGAFELSQLPTLPMQLEAALAQTASALGLDRLSPARGFEDSWHDTRGALPDGQTVLLRWLSFASPEKQLPPLSASVLSPAQMIVRSEFTFTGEWEPDHESEGAAKTRLVREFKQRLDAEFSATRTDAKRAGYESTPAAVERARDMHWLYLHLRDRLAPHEVLEHSQRHSCGPMTNSRDPEELIRKAVVRMAGRVGASTRRL